MPAVFYVAALPFESNSFDALSCRFGFVFFPDMPLALKERYRVIKPGGKIATSALGAPEKNFRVTAIMGTINRQLELPAPPAGASGMFRCAAPGLLAGPFKEAGFSQVTEHEVRGTLRSETAERYCDIMTEVGAPIVAALSKADEHLRLKIKTDVTNMIHRRYGQQVEIDSGALMVSGIK